MNILDMLNTPVAKESEKGVWRIPDDGRFSFFYAVGPTKPLSSEKFRRNYKSQRTLRRLMDATKRRKAKKGEE